MKVEASQTFFDDAFAGSRVMAILRGFGVSETVKLCERAWDAGMTLVEVPLQGDTSEDALRAAVRAGAAAGHPVGAGTITTTALVDRARLAGAAFTVAPGFDADVATYSIDSGLPHLPGVATGTEVQSAFHLGLRWQKAFPAGLLGAEWFSAMSGSFPLVRFVATGEISAANAPHLLDAGAAAVSFGSAFSSMSTAALRALSTRTPAD
jgi:2-dehydro-3-deoxyphosphogluconate aldolase/(4S)-4-hydroxy-2-oxoglutarate aldolase